MRKRTIRLILKLLITFFIFMMVFILAAMLQDWSSRPPGWVEPPIWWLFP